jgi:maleate isomerase
MVAGVATDTRLTVGPPPRLRATDPAARFGLVALATDLTMEGDLAALLPAEARLHVTRVTYANPTTPENLAAMGPRLAEAAAVIAPEIPLTALCFGCTAGAAVIGNDVIAEAFAASRPGVPTITPPLALLGAARVLGISRIAVLTPYLPQTTVPLLDFFDESGLEVVSARCMGVEDDRDMARIEPDSIREAALAADDPRAEALFLSCTALPALALIEELEARVGKPVLTSNQVCAWAMLHLAGLSPARPVGRLFAAKVPA